MKPFFALLFSLIFSVSGLHASSPKYVALADSADNFIKQERWTDAERVIENALRLEPGNFTNSLLLSNLGVVRTNLGKMEQALESFRLGLSIAPRSSVIRTNRARTFLFMGKYDEALEDLDSTLEIDSLQQWPLKMRGLIRLSKDDAEGAKADFLRLLKLSPDNPAALTGLARVEQQLGHDNEALALYDRSLAIEDDPEARFSRIILKINLGKFSEASADISQSISKYPEIGDFYLARGFLHRRNYRNDEAKIDKKIAIDKGADPQLVEQFIPEIGK